MDNRNVIASALTDYELARAFSELVAERWDDWDLTQCLPYLVDTCAPAVLPYLADQFDVDGLRGFAMVENKEQQREIIKKSIALHKYIGTPWAIREACRTVGFPVIVLQEGVTEISGGSESPEDWARFRVLVEADMSRLITTDDARKLRLFVEFYKNERSHLAELGFYQGFSDKLRDINEELDVMFLSLSPNPAIIDPRGKQIKVSTFSNVEWSISQNTFDWGDGSGDKLTITYTGNAGHSDIYITSDPYAASTTKAGKAYSAAYSKAYHLPEGIYDREIRIDIFAPNWRVLGVLTVRQKAGQNNAYSRAYSNAYNLFDHKPFIEFTPTAVWLSAEPETVQVQIESNTDWKIE